MSIKNNVKFKNEQPTSTNVQVKQQAGAITTVDLEKFADTGFDNVDSKSLAYHF